ncbi:anaerobic ribonucleoside triphosphate reductase [Subdoligranulum sp. AM23-21AC]|uniref:anaerobic ribonucleoside triphosphate reductase n=1 Tax=Ruthenibacterium lactatiformans TaxID=1550024 RepID=UPI000E3F6313|nr:anaerobic ribonucleoside triphosphate reductase [Ruthenibacterium lactatiformans]RGD21073.1 anaerobic ribonucleoside triphosphate reductase [Subdoligranulum sp. AM23-21AC]RJW32423.1 anaerobic ribonucleoside triphosphate reductase [Subdoligranulum sp. TF05-17AC]
MIKSIIKRDGRVVLYDEGKIASAILKAMEAAQEGDASQAAAVANAVEAALEERCGAQPPQIEQIQDEVESQLMQMGFDNAAKKYILYRASRTRVREMNTRLMKVFDELTHADATASDMKRSNANIDGDTPMGTMLQYGSEAAKDYYDKYLLTPEQSRAHREGWIHIHDFDFYALTTTCCQIDLLKLFKGGFSTGHGFLREPNDIQSYSALACIAIQSNQNDQHGGQSIVNFDYGLAPGVAKTYKKQYAVNIFKSLELLAPEAGVTLQQVKDTLRAIEAEQGLRPQLATDMDYLRAETGALTPLVGGDIAKKAQAFALKETEKETEKATYQAMEALIHNLNTMHSRAGAQTPFSSINYGTDISPEGRMVMRNVLLATDAGLGHGETPIFPIQIFRVKEGVNYNPGDPNYDLFQLSCKVSAKRLFPNFSFIDSPFNLQYYKPGHPETEVSYMGCRTRVMGNVYDPSQEIANGRGNLSFTSINLPRLAIESHGDEALFYEKLKDMMELVIGQLDDRFAIQSKKRVYNFPFLMGQGVWLDSEKLGPNDEVGEVLKHGTLSIGFIGLAETLISLYGHHHGESDAMQEKGLAIVQYMRRYLDARSERTHMNYSLLATPAEGLSGRFVRMDKKRYGLIPGVTDKDYYTNSFHIPVYYNISAYEKIRKEAPYHALTNAGHISYVELDGDTANNLEAFESIVRCMHDCGIGYGSINHPVDRDPICGYVGVIGEVCPRCGRREGEAVSPERIKELRKLYPGTFTYCGCE